MAMLLGFDLGSSSIKACLLDGETGKVLASAQSPQEEMEILAPQPGWAEQHPVTWWEHITLACRMLKEKHPFDPQNVQAIGISYQMHGLVLLDREQRVLRPAIIWCDSRAVEVGRKAGKAMGENHCLNHLMNLPGNFTASKLRWVKENEPEIFSRVWKMLLPGDYIALKMTGECRTTPSGLSEGILWDFTESNLAHRVLDYFNINADVVAEQTPNFAIQGRLRAAAAEELGLRPGIPVAYRAGDQPNNALSLNVLEPGEAAVTAGTSAVIYGVSNKTVPDSRSRVNVFLHVNHQRNAPRHGILLCLNGAAILNVWLRRQVCPDLDYPAMNDLAAQVPPGSEGLMVLPFGNGAERMLENRNPGASILNLDFNRHSRAHLLRAGQEAVAFALAHGFRIMQNMGQKVETIRAGKANLFLSPLFAETFATVTGAKVELFDTDGAQGAARGGGIGAGIFQSYEEAFTGLTPLSVVQPDPAKEEALLKARRRWEEALTRQSG